MKNNKLGSLFWILLVVCILNIVGHLAVYPALPDTVPIHWGASGEVNGWSSKQSNLIFCVLPLAMLVFMEVVRRIDPKHQNFERFGKVWNIFITLMVLLTAGMTWLTELTVFNMLPQSSNIISLLVCGGVGVMFIILGNFMPNIKQNYTFGCRTPWALNDEHNWQRTQRMGGYTFVVMGIVLLVLAFLGGLLGDIALLCAPAAAFNAAVSAGQESPVYRDDTAARQLYQAVQKLRSLVSMTMLTALQAIDLSDHKAMSPVTQKVHDHARQTVTFMENDDLMYQRIEAMEHLVESNQLLADCPVPFTI